MDEKDCEYISENLQQDHKNQIIGMIVKIENPWILKQILQFIVNMTKED